MQAISTQRTLEQIETEIKAHTQYVTASIIAIGNALIEAKAQLDHGRWEQWLSDRVQFSQRTANNFMRIAREIGPASSLASLPYTKALALLEVPAEQREQVASEVDANNRSAAALRKAITDRKKAEEARQAAEQRARRAEELSEKYNDEMCRAQRELETVKARPAPAAEPVEVPPDDYEACKAQAAQAEALRRRAEEAEEYAERQEAAAREAQAKARRLEKEQAERREAADEEPYSAARLGESVRAFLAGMGTLPHMGAYFFGLSADKLAAYRPHVAMMRAWVEGAEAVIQQADAEKAEAIDAEREEAAG